MTEITYEEIAERLACTVLADASLPSGMWDEFLSLSANVHENFEVPSTTVTPMMRRLLFAIGRAARPSSVVGVGTYVGYGFSWLLGERSASGTVWTSGLAVDRDQDATALAASNLAHLGHEERLTCLAADGSTALAGYDREIELLFIDVDDPGSGKSLYRDILASALPVLARGAVVVAHDACVARFAGDFEKYHEFMDSTGRFTKAIVLPADECGLSVATVR